MKASAQLLTVLIFSKKARNSQRIGSMIPQTKRNVAFQSQLLVMTNVTACQSTLKDGKQD
ncbi:MAG: hypothetical protein PUE80_02735 [bacterium]|nr:hypothetical protein [bacterium]MDD6902151.1 hypothetical protein [bacterium]